MTTQPERSCPGHCCHTIYLPGSLDDIRRLVEDGVLIDGPQILDMVEPTGETTGVSHHYTCRNWDPDTQLCTDYANRPAMCRDYPYGNACEHCGLTDGIPPQARLALERANQQEDPT